MINKAKKGYTKEKRCRDELKEEGWMIVFKSIRFRFGCVDFAGLFDVVAYKGEERKFISCKHFGKKYNNYLPHQKEISDFKKKHGLRDESYELWIWHHPKYEGRGKNKVWVKGHWDKKIIEFQKCYDIAVA